MKFDVQVDASLAHLRTWGECPIEAFRELLQVAVLDDAWTPDHSILVDDRSPDRTVGTEEIIRIVSLADLLDAAPGEGRAALVVRRPAGMDSSWLKAVAPRPRRRTRVFDSVTEARAWLAGSRSDQPAKSA